MTGFGGHHGCLLPVANSTMLTDVTMLRNDNDTLASSDLVVLASSAQGSALTEVWIVG